MIQLLQELLSALSNLGGCLVGLAAILGLRLANKAVRDYWRIKRANAASAALSKLRICIDDLNDIASKKDLYKYPSFPQEISIDKLEKIHPERPARLVESKIKQLQRDLHESVSQLSGKEGAQLLQLISKLQGYSPQLSSAIFTSIRASEGCEAAKEQLKPIQHHLDNCQTTLATLGAEADKFLIPIIESIEK